MRFAEPYALLLLAVLPVVLILLRRHAPARLRFPAVDGGWTPRATWRVRARAVLPWLRIVVLALAIIALARPQWGLEVTKVVREGIAILMVVDISTSMGARDLAEDGREESRLDVVKRTFRAFVTGEDARTGAGSDPVAGRTGDAIGMVTFAQYADVISPPTLDHEALLATLDAVSIVTVSEEDGTAIGDAVVLGADALARHGTRSRVMIVLTDGSNNAGDIDPVTAAGVAASQSIRIYTIGAGSRGQALTPARDEDGTVTMRDAQVYIDEFTLTKVAERTGGRYFRAADADALRAIYREIDRLEKAPHVAQRFQHYREGYPLVILLALVLLLAEIALANTRLRTVP